MTSDFDISAAARECADRLADSGYVARAHQLRDAVDGASTGGELVMALRWHLKVILRDEEGISESLRDQIHRIINAIDGTGW